MTAPVILDALGLPVSSPAPAPEPTPEGRQVTFADLDELLRRMAAAEQRMSVHNAHKLLLRQAGWWLVNLAEQHVALTQQLAAATAQVPPADEPRIVLAGDTRG